MQGKAKSFFQGVDEGADFLENFSSIFEQISEIDTEIDIDRNKIEKSRDLSYLTDKFNTTYVYSGSLSWPPCEQFVTWIISADPVKVPNSVVGNICTNCFDQLKFLPRNLFFSARNIEED